MTTSDKQSHAIENFQNIPRCGAKTRSGKPCQSPCIKGKRRCRMHGGNAGAPMGNKNAWKHGGRSQATIDNRKYTNGILREAREMIKRMEADRKRNGRTG
ncbi:MAG: hypothetical protein CVV42_10675 [Candidatus Riflebacteria bacterium HGW-Riflebacteria-2]|nr:MAG: hypothetical protein CVV42_10675 [Candidatus Riflebacteria bacterium HGW-Riflebacteria-2]